MSEPTTCLACGHDDPHTHINRYNDKDGPRCEECYCTLDQRTIAALRAEVERLYKVRDDVTTAWRNIYAENVRLRAEVTSLKYEIQRRVETPLTYRDDELAAANDLAHRLTRLYAHGISGMLGDAGDIVVPDLDRHVALWRALEAYVERLRDRFTERAMEVGRLRGENAVLEAEIERLTALNGRVMQYRADDEQQRSTDARVGANLATIINESGGIMIDCDDIGGAYAVDRPQWDDLGSCVPIEITTADTLDAALEAARKAVEEAK